MVVHNGYGYLERPRSSGLAEVVDLILDKGLVIDAFVRVSVLGLELLTIDARIVVASVDTYLRYAEAVDRLVLESSPPMGLGDLVGGLRQSGAKEKTAGAIEGVKESVRDSLDVGEKEAEPERTPSRRRNRGSE